MDEYRFSDEELTAFLDGEADDVLAQRVEAALSDPDVSARVASLAVPVGALADAGQLALQTAPPPPNLPEAIPADRRGGAAGWAAAAVAGAVIGAAVMFYARPETSRDWVAQVASYQALYVAETLALAPQPRPVADGVLEEFAAVTGLDMSATTALDGASFERAQVLGVEGAPLLQMVFALPDGTPMALCVTPIAAGDETLRMDEAEGLALSRWQRNGFGFVVIGGTDSRVTARLAEQAQAALAL